MKISLSWLKELVDYDLTPKQLAERLSLISIGVKKTEDDFLELDLTYNRGDLLSLRGVARELAAITNSNVKFEEKEWGQFIFGDKVIPEIKAIVEDDYLCPLYCLVKIEDLSVKPSPKQWVKKLEDSGLRSINNVADLTNLIMLEYGQPMHAFDASKIKGAVCVRLAKDKERLLTLDGQNRQLNIQDLVIADEERSIGLAGVMGGKDSEVSDSTTSILLEAAIFDPVNIRRTVKRHNLPSEASKRFLHGLTRNNLLQALNETVRTYMEYGGKMTAFIMIGQSNDTVKRVRLTRDKTTSLLGVEIPNNKIESSLKSLGFHLRGVRINSWEITVPYWRLDINIEEDVIEEIARMYGYEKIEGAPLPEEKIPALDQTLPNYIYGLKLKLKQIGLTEVETYSFYSTAALGALEFDTETKKDLIKVANPISSETEYLRMDLWPNLVEIIGRNIKQGFKDIGIFEIGKVYSAVDGQVEEDYRLSIALMNGSDNPLEELAVLVQSLGLDNKGIKLNTHLFHPKRQKDEMGEVHLRVLNKLGIEKRVAVTEFQL